MGEHALCPACGHLLQIVCGPGGHQLTTETGKETAPAVQETRSSSTPTILVAEDTAYFCELVRATLGSRYRTIVVSSKAEAVAVLKREPIELLLLDLSLRGDDDGRDVLREMGAKQCPILIFTALDEAEMYGETWKELKALGADDVLIKGMHVEENLLLKVEQLLGKRT
ncbi:MAG: response regulator [Acidobacteriota bacterium]